MMSGGAERIGLASFHKSMFNTRVDELRKCVQSIDGSAPSKMRHISDTRGAAVQGAL
jgi:hypothetical protein